MKVYRLSLEALDALQAMLDEVNTERRGDVTVRISIDDGLKIKLDEAGWSRPYDLIDESRQERPVTSIHVQPSSLLRYRLILSSYLAGNHLDFSAANDAEAIEFAQRVGYGARVVELTESLIDGSRRMVELP
jgi:hypothetical protein